MPKIPALDGVDRLVGTLDALCAEPVDVRDLPVIIVDDEEDTQSAAASVEAFVLGYRARLLDHAASGLLPSALVDGVLLDAVARAAEPDVDLLERLGRAWQDTMPRSGGRLKLTTHQICNDVLTAPVGIGQANRQRDDLVDHLVAAWRRRTPGLRMLQSLLDSDGSGGITHILVQVLSILIGEPLKWFYTFRLDRTRRLRWYTEQVSRAGQPSRGFLSAAVNLGQHGILRENVALRQKLLIEALGLDLIRASRRGLMSPSRRRRVWSFVLLLQEIGDLHSPARRMLDGWAELKTRLPNLPVVIVAGHAGPFEPVDADHGPRTPRRATEELVRLLNPPRRKPAGRRPESQLVVRLPEGPELVAVRDWLDTNVEARPRRVGWLSAYLGWLLIACLVLALGGGAVVWTQHWKGPCGGLEWQSDGETVGVDLATSASTTDCFFDADPTSQLSRLQTQIRRQNAAVIDSGEQYRTVVFNAPLTVRPSDHSAVLPSGTLQLKGSADAQKAFNAKPFPVSAFRIVLRVANSGEDFDQGAKVVAKINSISSPGDPVVAVIGVSESKQQAVTALRALPTQVPIIGAATTGPILTELLNYFGTQTPNQEIAHAIAAEVKGRQDRSGKPMRIMLIQDSGDAYSSDLYLKTRGELRSVGIRPDQSSYPSGSTSADAKSEGSPLQTLAQRICTLAKDDGLPIYLGRNDQLPNFFSAIQQQCGSDPGITSVPILAGDAVTELIESPDTPAIDTPRHYPIISLSYVSFSQDGYSEQAAGADALNAAAAAISQAGVNLTVDEIDGKNVLQSLSDSDLEVPASGERQGFSISDSQREPVGRGTLYICSAQQDRQGGSKCRQSPQGRPEASADRPTTGRSGLAGSRSS